VKNKNQIGAAIEDLDPPEDMSVQEGIYLPVNQNKWRFLIEKCKALDKSIQRIEDAVMETLSQTPPELADIYNTGIYLAGGGSMLRGLDKEFLKNRLTCLHCRRSFKSSSSRNRNGA
jgi:rod shape-determining protein MreB